jgi:CTP synthase N-terminus
VLVTGGVVSGLGKGVTASSIGVLLKACGLRVTSIKIGTLHLLFIISVISVWLLFSRIANNLGFVFVHVSMCRYYSLSVQHNTYQWRSAA